MCICQVYESAIWLLGVLFTVRGFLLSKYYRLMITVIIIVVNVVVTFFFQLKDNIGCLNLAAAEYCTIGSPYVCVYVCVRACVW